MTNYDIERILLDLVSGLVPKTINYKKAKEACGVQFMSHICCLRSSSHYIWEKVSEKKYKKRKSKVFSCESHSIKCITSTL